MTDVKNAQIQHEEDAIAAELKLREFLQKKLHDAGMVE